jgi:hypothetical protein
MMITPKFISASELSREANCSVGKITSLVEAGILTPAGRMGKHSTAAMIFMREDLDALLAVLRVDARAKATPVPTRTHTCKSTAEVRMKAAALHQARRAAQQ